MLNILIIDDEKPARDRLFRLLEPLPDYTVCGEASNGHEALEQIRQPKRARLGASRLGDPGDHDAFSPAVGLLEQARVLHQYRRLAGQGG